MNLTAWVDVAIGLMVVYLGASLLVTVINEYIAQGLNLRGRQLSESLQALVGQGAVRDLLSKSPEIKPFFDGAPGKAPSYVDPNVLARILIGGLTAGSAATGAAAAALEAVGEMPDSALKTQLQAVVGAAEADRDGVVKAVGEWADRSLTMLGEGYKSNLQKISFAVGLAVAAVLNIDTLALTEHLYRDKDAREAVVALGVQVAASTNEDAFKNCLKLTPQQRKEEASCAAFNGLIDAVQMRNESLGKLPIGWGESARDEGSSAFLGATRFLGWVLTAFALSLGAPFWFDLLGKLVNIRHGMKKPEVAQEKAK